MAAQTHRSAKYYLLTITIYIYIFLPSYRVTQVRAISFKRNQGVEYQIIAPLRPKHIIRPDGTITLDEAVDREHMDSYVLVIEAREPISGGLASTTKVSVDGLSLLNWIMKLTRIFPHCEVWKMLEILTYIYLLKIA